MGNREEYSQMNYEEYYNSSYIEDDYDFNDLMQELIKTTPWWGLAIGIHILALLIFSAINLYEPNLGKALIIKMNTKNEKKEVIICEEPKLKKEIKEEKVDDDIEFEENENEEVEKEVDIKGDPEVDSKNLEKKFQYTSNGVGGGSDTVYGSRTTGGKRRGRKISGGVETAIPLENALIWLANHQSPDGHWDSDGFSAMCKDSKCSGGGDEAYDVGQTGLALLAFLGAGYSHESKMKLSGFRVEKVIQKGLRWLQDQQDAEGCFGPQVGKYMYNHSVAALAMAEAYGLTGSRLLKDSAQNGINFLSVAQNPYKAWRYTKKSGDNDTSVSGWCTMALKSGRKAGLVVPESSFDGVWNWLIEVTDEAYYQVGYTAKGTGKVFVPSKNEDWAGHESMTAVGMMCRSFIKHDKSDPALKGGAQLLIKDLPVWDTNAQTEKPIDYYYWYYATLAMFQYDAPNGKYWKEWNEAMKNVLLPHQRKDGCAFGSWDPEVSRWGFEGGRVYATALNAMTLEVYFRYEKAFTGD